MATASTTGQSHTGVTSVVVLGRGVKTMGGGVDAATGGRAVGSLLSGVTCSATANTLARCR